MDYVNCFICKTKMEGGVYCEECKEKIISGKYGLEICPKCNRIVKFLEKGKTKIGEECPFCQIIDKYTVKKDKNK